MGKDMMKTTMALILIVCTPFIVSATEITPPNMDPGHWITTVDQSAIIEQALSRVPKGTRAMVEKMVKEQLKETSTTEQCITPETLANFDKQMKDTFSEDRDCDFNVSESTSEKFVAELTCTGAIINIVTSVVNSKRNESVLTTNIAGLGETIVTSVSEWKSETCPKGL